MKKAITDRIGGALSGADVLKIAGPDTKIIDYGQLKNYDSIDHLFGNKDKIVMLLETRPNSGHWMGLLRYPKCIEVFDSYSYKPDNQLNFVPKNHKKQLGEDAPYLSKLLYEDGRPVVYLKTRLQKLNNKIATCGRWVGMRLRLYRMNCSQFIDLIKKYSKELKLKPDELICLMTIPYEKQ